MERRIAQSALEDMQAVQTHYVEQGVPHIGQDYVTEILKHAEILLSHLDAGRMVPEFGEVKGNSSYRDNFWEVA